jgi:hypothetical protein
MKTLDYRGFCFLYKIIRTDCGDDGVYNCFETIFYDGETITKTRKKWILFGPIVEYKVYNELFRLYCNIESTQKTRRDVQKILDKQIDLLKRIEEIKNGNII